MTTSAAPVDFQGITARQQATWALGDFNEIAKQTMIVAEDLCRAADPKPGSRVLDVACGSGNAALVAARRYCHAAGVDYVPSLIEHAKARAAAEQSTVEFVVGDAQDLHFPDATFDTVLSIFGVMFAPDQERAARELLRVAKPGATIALANWMPEGFGGDFFRAHARFMPAPAGVQPPVRWGTPAGIRELFGDNVSQVTLTPSVFRMYFLSPKHAFEMFERYFGPTNRALQTLTPDVYAELRTAVMNVFGQYNAATDGTAMIDAAYMQVVATRA